MYLSVMCNPNISPAAKGVYAYLAARSGVSDECYPSVETITRDMGMVKDTFYRHINALIAFGVVEKHQSIGENGKFGRTIYRLTHEVTVSEKQDFSCTNNSTTDNSITDASESKDNSTKDNISNNKNTISCSPDDEREPEKAKKPAAKTSAEQDEKDFEVIYDIYPKKRGRAKAFEYYRGYVNKGREIDGIRWKLDRRQIYIAVAAYVKERQQEGTELRYYKNFDVFMNKTILDYLPKEAEE